MVDKASLGIKGEPFTVVVERGKVYEFCSAIGASHPDHSHPTDPAIPATFLTTQFHWERVVPDANPWEKVKMDPKRGMHAEQEFVFHGPPPEVGDVLTAQSHIADIREKEGRRGGTLTFVTMITEYRDTDGVLVAEAKLTGVETGQAPKEET